MKFRNYCVVIMGDTKNVLPEIEKISETPPNYLNGGGLLVATITSSLEPVELTDWFKLNKRSFLVFVLDPKVSGFNITKKPLHDGLFGFLEHAGVRDLDNLSMNLLRSIELTSDTKNIRGGIKEASPKVKKEVKITEGDIKKMTIKERQEMWNEIMDENITKGLENLTEYDKDLLQRLLK